MPEQREMMLRQRTDIAMGALPVHHTAPGTAREVLSIFFRNRRLIELTFLVTLAGVVLAVFLFGMAYESNTEILVKHRRADQVISTDSSSREAMNSTDAPTEREINTEISLLKGGDLMAQVVKDCGLDASENHFWNRLFPGRDASWRLGKAARKLSGALKINEVPQSNLIQISYRSSSPEQAQRVLSDLDRLYLAKHLAVYRPPGAFDFFHRQAEFYHDELAQAEQQLASYDLTRDASDPELDKEILLRKAGEFESNMRETQAAISQSSKQVNELSSLLQKTPDRLQMQITAGDNPQLLAFLKSNVAELETKRTDLLTKYQPTYRLVQDVDKQIADLQAAIAREEKKPVRQESTGENPTYELLKEELVKANENLAGYRAKEQATAPLAATYRQQALLVDRKGIERQDLIRNVKAAEVDYMLYVQKQEQARIADEMDKDSILNVTIAETPGVPSTPVFSPLMLLFAGCVLAVMISVAIGFFADYFDPSFRTPEEVVQFLDTPLLACFARNGHPPRFGLLTAGADTGAINVARSGNRMTGRFMGVQDKRG